MALSELFDAVREAAGSRVWGAAVKLARDGVVRGVSDDGDEVHLEVKGNKAMPHEVYLWPGDPDWGCDCGLPSDACVHVAAAAIALKGSRQEGGAPLPEPSKTYQVKLRYAFASAGAALRLDRLVLYTDGRIEPLTTSLAEAKLLADRGDVQAETLLALHPGGPLDPETLRRLLVFLEGTANATLDDKPVKLSDKPVQFRVRVTDDGDGFRVGLYRPAGISTLYRGAALVNATLHPTSHGDLTQQQRRMLVKGVHFSTDEVGLLVGEYLPKLRDRAPVDLETKRLPQSDALVPRVAVHLIEKPGGLQVRAEVVYGDPAVGRVTNAGTLERLSAAVVPARDLGSERVVAREFRERTGMSVGFARILPPSEAAGFLELKLHGHSGPVHGKVDPKRFEVHRIELTPGLGVTQVPAGGIDPDEKAWHLDVSFGEGRHAADPDMVLQAWRTNRSLVPLLEGGWAPLPADWLAEHGALLQELLEARDRSGRVGRNATAALVELLEDTTGDVPPDLRALREWLEGGEGLPDVEPPPGLKADLRPYQRAGLQWLHFLRDMQLNGILADDMGLGKTVQALAAMLDAGGRHLVIAPTSVLRTWEIEAKRFAPELSVNVFHGPDRTLDDSDLTLTSYALLRLDLERLRETEYTYAVLDEAQAIKNARSQTARAACSLRAHHRVCLTGTPVENRLEELWSLFRFLMPGLLGSQEAFRDRFVKPLEAGDPKARTQLRTRVRPYILRRLKSQVATELPSLTEVVVRCELGEAQRRIYDGVRLAARHDVQQTLAQGGRVDTMQVLEALLRMRQACCDPSLLPGDAADGVPASKLDRMEELLVELVAENHKALVFSQWTSLLDRVEPRLEALGIAFVRLDGSTRDRQKAIDTFQSDDGPPVFLLSLKAGGTGLNLTAADYVLHLDPWWNPAVERQATDRAHRIGQDKPVVSCKLIAEDTVEERIVALQDAKRNLADAALGTEGGFIKSLTAEELRGLFDGD